MNGNRAIGAVALARTVLQRRPQSSYIYRLLAEYYNPQDYDI